MNLGVGSVVKNMSSASCSVSWKSGGSDKVSDQFPAGLRVLVIDDDPTCLRILEKMLRNCHYEVTKSNRAELALSMLRENRNGFDIVISEVHMPDMDGFKLLEHVGLEMDLPVIMMSADDSKHVVMKAVTHGACDYLIKPVRIEALKNICMNLGVGSVVKNMSGACCSVSWKSGGSDKVSDQFPAGLRVLVVDDDPTCLRILEKMLRNCHYEVTKSNRAELALSMLRENRNGFDIVISEVHMPDMDGFKLLEHVGLEMDLPVIMMSADDSKHVVMKAVTHGACDYLIKPVRIEALKNICMNLGVGSVVKNMSGACCSVSWKSGGSDKVSDQFPAGLRVLVVDDDPTCLRILEKMLRNCHYEVTKSNRAELALSMLRENRNGFDIVISEVHMPDMDGFKLLEHVGLEMDLPVIMMSADDSKHVVMKAVTHGACDYLIKPVRIEALKNICMNLGVGSVVKNMSGACCSVSWKSGGSDKVSDQFPAGLRVLVVDDDPTCLRILEKMLRNCHYEVTKSNRAELALSMLRENRNGFDIVISEVHMPDMDGFKLLEHVGLEMDLPVIMMSADDSKDVVMKAVTHGACDYLIKPVRIEELKNIWQHVKNMSGASCSVSWKSGGSDKVSDQFPAGLRVLVVDDDPTCLRILEKMLRNCHYEVTKSNRAELALSMLRENRNGFDIVISDVHMPDMDGFKLLEHVGMEMDLPVIMMSADDSKDVVMKGVTHGACDYLIKPVRIEALKNIWQHVIRKKKHEWKDKDFDQSTSVEDGDQQQKPPEDVDYSSSANEGNWKSSKRRKEEEDETEERDDSSTLKKPRVVWSVELHQQFVQAVNQLGIDKAVPKKILELMNVPGLTRENVASHLQKYRLYLRRLSGVSQHQNGMNNSATYGTMTYFNGLELQALAGTGQLPAQTLQAAALGRSATKSKLRFSEGQQQLNKQINLLHGIPTTMELHQSFVAINMQGNARMQQNNALLMHMSQQSSFLFFLVLVIITLAMFLFFSTA